MGRVEIIGDATLYLGDCREILPTLPMADVVVTDPPYGMEFVSNYRLQKYRPIANDISSALLIWACGLNAAHSKYIFARWDNLSEVPAPKSCVTWIKNNWSMGDLDHEHARQTELILFYPGPDHTFPKKRPTDAIEAPRTGNDNHPSEKPVQLMRAILEWTSGDVVDPFMGSGSTGVAAVGLGRRFAGIEIDPAHFDTACRRLETAWRAPELFSNAVSATIPELLL